MQGSSKLAVTLSQDARIVLDAGHTLALAEPPRLGPWGTAYLMLVQEDLLLCSDGLGSLLTESAAAVQFNAAVAPAQVYVNYGPRVIALVAILSRAEAWLETLDHHVGTHAMLPGFGSDASPLASELALY
jgi:hypothetical protein